MSQKILQEINNIVDNQLSDYYYYNKRKRHFWHSKSVTVSCRVRDKNNFNNARDMSINIRSFLLKNDESFLEKVWSMAKQIQKKNRDQLKNYVYSLYPDTSKEELDKKMGIIIMNLPEEEIKVGLNLRYVVSCKLLGYEKEFFFLKCYKMGIWPSFILRCLYHTEYLHSKFEKELEGLSEEYKLTNPYKGLEFNFYLDKIKFV